MTTALRTVSAELPEMNRAAFISVLAIEAVILAASTTEVEHDGERQWQTCGS